MSTAERPAKQTLPPLMAGDRLSRSVFHARYAAMPPHVRAELVGGIVSMPSPLSNEHGEIDLEVSYWLGHYKRMTPGVSVSSNATVQFEDYGEVQPDLQVRIPEHSGGQSRVVGGYVVGAPELVAEISRSSLGYDLGPKRAEYERAGVLEYLVFDLVHAVVSWYVRRDGRYVGQSAGEEGVYRSGVFPGLWLDARALFAGDADAVVAALDLGLATAEHAGFVQRLARNPRAWRHPRPPPVSEDDPMSTAERPAPRTSQPLVAGERLTRSEFHARYAAMPPHVRPELVGGVVHMPSPLGLEHGDFEADLAGWLWQYKRHTPGVRLGHNATVQFEEYGEPQPDLHLRIEENRGGRAREVGGYLVGGPELVVEVSQSSLRFDLGPKKADYEQAGVGEYLVVDLDSRRLHWFVLRAGLFAGLAAGADGVYRSEVFPGLWLDARAYFDQDAEGVIALLDRGLATAEHVELVARLAQAPRG